MIFEDRVITSDQLLAANAGSGGWCQLGPGVLQRLDPVGTHVVVAAGPVMDGEETSVIRCSARLRLAGERQPLDLQLLMPLDDFLRLPTTFDVLVVAADLAQGVASEVESWLQGGLGAD